jgi:cell division protein FtsX
MKKEKFYIAVCIISLVASWTLILKLNVFTYFDWEFLIRIIELMLGMMVAGICFMFGVDIYKDKIKGKIFNKNDTDRNNKAA